MQVHDVIESVNDIPFEEISWPSIIDHQGALRIMVMEIRITIVLRMVLVFIIV